VPRDVAGAARALEAAGRRLELPGLVGAGLHPLEETVLRWTVAPAALPDAGVWRPAAAPGVPPWLRPFGGEVLVVLDARGRYLAGVGLKRHDPTGIELAVGTEPAVRNQGLARRLVAQAARAVLADGAVPTYRHHLDNEASARVAEAAGFPDRGWRHVGLAEAA
jgi:GNAT superfamily N-acetyltransferase